MDNDKINSVSIDEVATKHLIYVVREDSPAFGVFRKILCTGHYRSGMVVPVSEEELESFRKDVLIMQVDDKDEQL